MNIISPYIKVTLLQIMKYDYIPVDQMVQIIFYIGVGCYHEHSILFLFLLENN